MKYIQGKGKNLRDGELASEWKRKEKGRKKGLTRNERDVGGGGRLRGIAS